MRATTVRDFLGLVLGLTALLHPCIAAGQQDESAWKNLSQLTHRASFTFTARDRKCVSGFLKAVSDTSVMVKSKDGKTTTMERADLLRVQRNWYGSAILFSGRSSWADVVALAPTQRPQLHPRIAVETRAGQKNEGILVSASDEGLMLELHDGRVVISKANIVRVSSIVQKPVSDSAAYADDELVFLKVFDPELWPAMFGAQGSLPVTLYDASLPEDNSQVTCSNSPGLP